MESIAQQKRIRIDIDGRTAVVTGKDDLYQGDSYANEIVVEVLRGGVAADLSGYTASGEMQRSDEAKVPCEGSVAGNVITIALGPHCYKEAGNYILSVMLSKDAGETTRTILRIYGEVQRAANGPTVDISETLVDVDAVLALYAEMKSAKEAAEEAAEIAKKVPIIADGGLWAFWDAAQGMYVESEHRSIPALTFEAKTGAAGTNVQMVITGTAEAPVITLTIPRGDTGAVEGLDYYEGSPAELGAADPGTANGVARGDHVHPLPGADALQVISYITAQALTEAQRLQALANIGGVAYSTPQALTEEQQAQARENIGAGEPYIYTLPAATDDKLGGVRMGGFFSAPDGVLTIDGEPAEIVQFIERATYSKDATVQTLVPLDLDALYIGSMGNTPATITPGTWMRFSGVGIPGSSALHSSLDTAIINFGEDGATSGTLFYINKFTVNASTSITNNAPTSATIGPVWMLRKIPQ